MSQAPYGCHDREPFKLTVVVQDGWLDASDGTVLTRLPRMKEIPFRNSLNCDYQSSNLGLTDPRCQDCRWKVPT